MVPAFVGRADCKTDQEPCADREAEWADELRLESPFCHQSQVLLYIASDLPDPRAADFEAQALQRLLELIAITDGAALVLFTSTRALRSAARTLRE